MRRTPLLSLALVATLLLSACSEAKIKKVEPTAADSTGTNQNGGDTDEETNPPATFKIGDSVIFDDLIITVNSLSGHTGGDYEKPEEGKVFIVVDATIENTAEDTANVSTLLMMKLADAEGYYYNPTIATFVEGQLDGQIPSGRKKRGQVAFQVPKDAAGFEFIFETPLSSSGQAIWSTQ
ncbi:DUF4352 domain-containing protein [Paenibacillus oenotherae]|uniref:DUF4352 domain-containing protein n=1 Tax=Paenibacillus oenotherae TaxID=1435645 RepID=A0ABS7D3N1_9BACL|nr:DUF4352 domain-containing protein [Paenibacillus oenotherae]MBW7473783.1 DUF4352 domain-containing protein [Paenibacillus oenotherae]